MRSKEKPSGKKSRVSTLRLTPRVPEDLDLATDLRLAVLAQSPRGGRFILWAIVVIVVFAVYWAHISEIEIMTRGQGKVIPSRQIQVVQNLEGGIVAEILVSEGQSVEKDQLLLRLDSTYFSGTFNENKIRSRSLEAKAARLKAEAEDAEFVLPDYIVKENPEIGEREQELYSSRKEVLGAALGILREKVKQRIQEIEELKAKQSQLTSAYELLRKELELMIPLVEQGAASEIELLRLRREESDIRGEITAARIAIPGIESKKKEAQKEINGKNLEYRNRAKVELNDVRAKLETMAVSSITLEDRLTRTMVRSPVHGTINRVLISTLGGVIQPGMDLIEIVPLEDSLLIEARIKPSDIGFLRPGLKANVKFSAYDFTIFGGLDATVEHISADSILDESGNSSFLVRVRTTKSYLGTKDDPLHIIPGMVATVGILTGEKTILSSLLKPFLRAKENALRER